MSDLLELFSRDPLSYTTDGKELETIIAKLRENRAAFNLGNLRAGSMKPKAEPKTATAKAAAKIDTSGLLAGLLKKGMDE